MANHKTYNKQKKNITLNSGVVLTYNLTKKNIKRMNLRIHATGDISLSAPRSLPLRTIEAFLLEKEDFILRSLQEIKTKESLRKEDARERMEKAYAYAAAHKLLVKRDRHGNELIGRMGFPGSYFNGMPYISGRQEMAALLANVSAAFNKTYALDLSPAKVSVRIMKSRWGSCRPSKGSITLNGLLYYVPRECMEYVIVHEYCHFLEANHSQTFWNHVEHFLPDYRERERLLAEYEPKLMPVS
jgi:predicted metal-dependent hydrolase